jgi:thiol-disulfide isomerase/thioredoxin
MRTWFTSVAVAAILVADPTARCASADGLNLGDIAPPLTVSKWVKGSPVDGFRPGRVYVVEFWATWCGPCRTSIPQLAELQKKHKGVTVIGVSVCENDPKEVEPFVKQMGDTMGYLVAQDDVPEDSKRGREGKMALAWMDAAGEGSIPTAFIVGKDGRIAWIGHPMDLDRPLEHVLADTWDVKVAAAERLKAVAARRAAAEGGKAAPASRKPGNPKELVKRYDELFAKSPEQEKKFGPRKLKAMLTDGDRDAAYAYATKLVDHVMKNFAGGLNEVAGTLSRLDDRMAPRELALALRAAERANSLTAESFPMYLDTLAAVAFRSGDASRALRLQARAVKLEPRFLKDRGVSDRLKAYREAVEGQKSK